MFQTVFQNIVAYGAAAIWIIVLVVWAIWYFKIDNISDNPEDIINELEEDINEGDEES